MNYKIILSVLSVALLVFVASLAAIELNNTKPASVTNFDECAAAGYPIMESYPEQCRTPDGKTFTRQIPLQENPAPTCFIGGCSNQICSDQPGVVSTCEYKEEYACYTTARCERQTDGQCGWTQTTELTSCLQGK